MLDNEWLMSLLITIFSLLFIFLVNKFIQDLKIKMLLVFLIFSESIVLTFLFDKFPFFLSFIIAVFSFYTLISLRLNDNSLFSNETFFLDSTLAYFRGYFRLIGFFLIICTLFYEYVGDATFSSNTFLVLLLALIFIIYEKIPPEFKKEGDFLLIFFVFISSFFVFPLVLFKIFTGNIGECNVDPGTSCDILSLFEESELVYFLLSKPLGIILNFLGYNVFVAGQAIFFEDLNAGRLQSVIVARSCAGIASIQIFISALLSYIGIEYKKVDSKVLFLIVSGIFFSYIANLFRMTIIVISGHYWGIETLLFVHEYIGWMIFTFWMFMFWIITNKVLNLVESN